MRKISYLIFFSLACLALLLFRCQSDPLKQECFDQIVEEVNGRTDYVRLELVGETWRFGLVPTSCYKLTLDSNFLFELCKYTWNFEGANNPKADLYSTLSQSIGRFDSVLNSHPGLTISTLLTSKEWREILREINITLSPKLTIDTSLLEVIEIMYLVYKTTQPSTTYKLKILIRGFADRGTVCTKDTISPLIPDTIIYHPRITGTVHSLTFDTVTRDHIILSRCPFPNTDLPYLRGQYVKILCDDHIHRHASTGQITSHLLEGAVIEHFDTTQRAVEIFYHIYPVTWGGAAYRVVV
ncbi:MAG: hypothetical protein ACFCUI_09150 [Bernardetiaceae bacterium]